MMSEERPNEAPGNSGPPGDAAPGALAAVPPIVWQVVIVESGLLVLAFLLALLFDLPGPFGLRLDAAGILWGVAATVPAVLAMVWSLRTSLPPFPRFRRQIESMVLPLFRGCTHWHLAAISLLAGLGEETLFRGVIQPGLAGPLGPVAAVAVTSVLFGLCHFLTPTYALMAALIGLYLGTLTEATGSLMAAVVVHALYDFIALEFLLRRRR